jgi:hypothetical protein
VQGSTDYQAQGSDAEPDTAGHHNIPILDQLNWQAWSTAIRRELFTMTSVDGTSRVAYVLRPDPYVPEEDDNQSMQMQQCIPSLWTAL